MEFLQLAKIPRLAHEYMRNRGACGALAGASMKNQNPKTTKQPQLTFNRLAHRILDTPSATRNATLAALHTLTRLLASEQPHQMWKTKHYYTLRMPSLSCCGRLRNIS